MPTRCSAACDMNWESIDSRPVELEGVAASPVEKEPSLNGGVRSDNESQNQLTI